MNTNKELKHLEIKGAIILLSDEIHDSAYLSHDNTVRYIIDERRDIEILDAKRIIDNAKYIIKLAENYKKIFP